MARTLITQFNERPIRRPLSLTNLRDTLQEEYATMQRDEDKAGDPDDAAFYEGNVHALKWVLGLITVDPDESEAKK